MHKIQGPLIEIKDIALNDSQSIKHVFLPPQMQNLYANW